MRKGEIGMNQEKLRLQVKLVCAYNDDIKIKDFANYLGITEHSFYNFMNGYYNLSEKKARQLYDVTIDLIEE